MSLEVLLVGRLGEHGRVRFLVLATVAEQERQVLVHVVDWSGFRRVLIF